MLEFALVALAFFALIGLMVDGGMAIRSKALLTEVLNEVLVDRSMALNDSHGLASELGVATECGRDCMIYASPPSYETTPEFYQFSELNRCVDAIGDAYLQKFVSLSSDQVTFTAEVQTRDYTMSGLAETEQSYFLVMKARWNYDCLFCGLFGLRMNLEESASARLELPNLVSSGVPCYQMVTPRP